MQILTNIDLAKNELQNARLQNLASAPVNPVSGQIYYNSTDKLFYGWNGTSWLDLSLVLSNKEILASITAAFTTELKNKLDGIAVGANNYQHPTTHAASMITGLSAVATSGSYTDLLNKPTLGTASSKNTGTASGAIPIIGADGKLDQSLLPALAISDTFVVATQTAMLALTAQTGDVAVRTDISKSFILRTMPATTLANWQELLSPSDSVSSVNGKTGAVTLTKTDVGLSNLDNVRQAPKDDFDRHEADAFIHVDDSDRNKWNGKTSKSSTIIGNGSATSFIVTHYLNTQDVTVTIRENTSPFNVVFADIQISSVNAITVLFASAPTSNQFKVVVTG